MTKEEKLDLYNRAKEAYYNGQEIMTDYEFDMLEKELGLENKSHIGARHNPSYTQKHPFIMGSLSKVQVHKDKEGNIDWKKYFTEAAKYFGRNEVIITPKFDGCSFESEINDGKLIQISSRGMENMERILLFTLYDLFLNLYIRFQVIMFFVERFL